MGQPSKKPYKYESGEVITRNGVKFYPYGSNTARIRFKMLNWHLDNRLNRFDEIIEIEKDDKTLGLIAVNITGWEIYVDIWAPHCPWTRTQLHTIFEHLFNTRRRITAIVSSENKKCQKFMKQLGFKREGRLRHAFDGKADEIYFGFLYSDYQKSPWFNVK